MKRVLASILCALVAASFAGTVMAADYGDPGQTGTMKNMSGSKKAKKKKAKKAKKVKKSSKAGGTSGIDSGTGPHYGTQNLGGPSGNEIGQPQPKENAR